MSGTKNTNKFVNTIDECLTNGVKNGIFQVTLEDDTLNGREVTIDGKRVINFGSCSYLGLEVDDRLKQGAIDATLRYGTQYSSSRLFSACNLYEELEDLFYKIFNNNPAVLAATTTLSHVGALPILVEDSDLVILDHQVHGSVQLAVQLLKAKGIRVEMIKHNRMDMLESIVAQNPNKFNKIWYMADGLYSMYGDYAPLEDIQYLMEKYASLHLYIDDAHGMSWTGKNGNGYVLSQMSLHPKMVLSTSLAKGFGTGGGVTVMSDKELMRKIKTCGSSYTYSGPVQPPMLGASIASAKIHLSEDIYSLQRQLSEKISLTRSVIDRYDLPLVLPSDSPIFYLGLGLPRVGYNMVRRLLSEGFYTNIGIFPGVPVKCCGLRLAVTNGQTQNDITNVLDAFQYHFPQALKEEGQSIEDIISNFDMPFKKTAEHYLLSSRESATDLDIQHETTIRNINIETWNELLGENGTFDWEGCKFIEDTFRDNPEPENNWKIHYLIIRDQSTRPILATFFTELLCKDDMIASAEISRQIEQARLKDNYYLTSKVIMMGCLLSVGDHLYIDRDSPHWKNALLEMLKIMDAEKEKCGATSIQLRDINSDDVELKDFFIQEGLIKVEMPDTHVVRDVNAWHTEDQYMQRLSTKSRWHFRRNIVDKRNLFNIKTFVGNKQVTDDQLKRWRKLYTNVKDKSLNINTYALPEKYFENILNHPNWEVIELSLKEPEKIGADPIVAVGFCYRSSKNNYSIMAVGLDYDYVVSHGCYRQSLFQSVARANELKCKNLYLGMDAAIEKRKFGAEVIAKSVYVQANDNFNMELIGAVYNKVQNN